MKRNRVNVLTVVNSASNITTETIDGKPHIVVRGITPVVDDIVMNRKLYPAAEIEKAYNTLERNPMPLGHPKVDGKHVSARDVRAVNEYHVGAWLQNVSHKDGKVTGDMYVNRQYAESSDKGKRLINRLDEMLAGTNSEPIHISTGLLYSGTSMSGQIGAALDAKSYTFDGTMVPIHDSGFKFNWRDPVFNKGSALSSLADAQAGSVDDVRRQYVDYIWEGFRDAAGNYIKFDDKTWKGLRHDERVAQVTLTVNFATSTDPKAMRAAAIALRDVLKLQNMQYGQQTWYVSSEIMSNWEQYFDVNSLRTVLEEISKLSGIAAIKEDAELTGNEIVIVPLQAGVIAPIVGQAFGTVADPRQFYNSDYVWRTWGAAGLMVKQDINGHYSVIHASS